MQQAFKAHTQHAQHFIAGLVAAQVVDFLEAVEVDADQRQLALARAGQGKFKIQTFVEVGAISETGERKSLSA
jgi:hypothetical protein